MTSLLKRVVRKARNILFGNKLIESAPLNFSEADLIYQFFRIQTSKNNMMIDVGAHVGGSFRPYEKLKWKIFAFEPNSKNSSKIGRISDLVELSDLAVSDTDNQEVTLYTSEVSSGISGLSAFHPSHKPFKKVKTITLRTFCKSKNIVEVDFLKIDTEGFDLFVLKGFPFELIQPKVILCEFEDIKTKPLGYTYSDLGNYLIQHGYTVFISEWYPIIQYGMEHTWRSWGLFPENQIQDKNSWGNFIALRNDFVEEFKEHANCYLQTIRK